MINSKGFFTVLSSQTITIVYQYKLSYWYTTHLTILGVPLRIIIIYKFFDSTFYCNMGPFPFVKLFWGKVPTAGRWDVPKSACWVSRCLLRSTLRWKALPQSSQAKGLKPVCFLECVIRLLLCENALPHTWHLWGFSPEIKNYILQIFAHKQYIKRQTMFSEKKLEVKTNENKYFKTCKVKIQIIEVRIKRFTVQIIKCSDNQGFTVLFCVLIKKVLYSWRFLNFRKSFINTFSFKMHLQGDRVNMNTQLTKFSTKTLLKSWIGSSTKSRINSIIESSGKSTIKSSIMLPINSFIQSSIIFWTKSLIKPSSNFSSMFSIKFLFKSWIDFSTKS